MHNNDGTRGYRLAQILSIPSIVNFFDSEIFCVSKIRPTSHMAAAYLVS